MYYTLLNICNAFYIKIDIEKMKSRDPVTHRNSFNHASCFSVSKYVCVLKKKKKSPVVLSTLHSKYFSFKYIFGNK